MRHRLVAVAAIALVALSGLLGMQILEYLNTPHTSTEKARASWQRENNYLYQQARATHGLPGSDQLARVDDIGNNPTPGQPTVLLLGDSTTYGTGLENLDMTWARILERTSNYHIVTYARPGASTTDYAYWLDDLIEAHQADAVIIAQTFNDHIPSPQTIERLCQQGDCTARLLETHPRYLECFNSANVVATRLQQNFPNLSRNVSALNCNPTQLSSELELPRVSDYRDKPEEFPYLPEYRKAVKELARQSVPIAVIPVSSSTNDAALGAYYLQAYAQTNIEVLSSPRIDRLIANPDPNTRTANPADEHPGTMLHWAYAQVAEEYLDTLNLKAAAADQGLKPEASPAGAHWLGTILPSTLVVQSEQNDTYAVSYTKGQGEGTQATPCARLGYPHVRLNLTQPGTYTVENSNDVLRASLIDYTQEGAALLPRHIGELSPAGSLAFTITSALGGSLLVGDPTLDCPEEGAIGTGSVSFTIAAARDNS